MRGVVAATVGEYLAAVPVEQRAGLEQVRNLLLAAIPDVSEGISYGIIVLKYRGRGLLGLSAAQKHLSLHLMSPALAKQLQGELSEGSLSGATVHFDPTAPLGKQSVDLIVQRRIAEVDG